MKMTIIYNSADNVLAVSFSCWILVAELGPKCIWRIVNVVSAEMFQP